MYLCVLAGFLLVDTTVYVTVGNIYYCHYPTLERVAIIYTMNADFKQIKEHQVGIINSIFYYIFVAILFWLEVFISSCIAYKNYKRQVQPTSTIQVQPYRLISGHHQIQDPKGNEENSFAQDKEES